MPTRDIDKLTLYEAYVLQLITITYHFNSPPPQMNPVWPKRKWTAGPPRQARLRPRPKDP